MDSCDTRTHAYRNGKTFDQCKDLAESMTIEIKKEIENKGKVLWRELLEKVNHDELVYKLTLKFLRRDGYNIGDWKTPEINKTL